MKKYIYSFTWMLIAALAFTACSSEDEYEWATVSGPQVYFSNTLGSTYDITVNENSFSIPVHRVDTQGALTVPLQVEASEGSIFNVPSSVSFQDGKNVADLVVTYNPDDVVYGKYSTIKLKIADENATTPYGATTYSFSAGATEWVDFGTGTFRDGLVGDLYGLKAAQWNVKVEKSIVKEGVYRIANPYATGAYSAYFKASDDLNTTIVIDASDPNFVVIDPFDSGCTLNSGDGEISFLMFVSYYLSKGQTLDEVKASNPDLFGKLEDNIITFAPRSWLATIGGNGYYYANSTGELLIALPGAVLKDYSLDFAYTGRFTDTSDNDYAQGVITLGADIESAVYAVVPGAEVETAYQELVEGTREGTPVPADGKISVQLEESGKYYVIVVAYDGGEAVASDAFLFKFKSSKETAETWTAQYVGKYQYTTKDYSSDQSGGIWEGTQDGVLYVSDSNPNRYLINPWADITEETPSQGLIFEMDEEGNITVDGVYTGYTDEEYGEVFATDIKTRGDADLPSYFENGVFYFNLTYHVAAGAFCFVQDTFTLTAEASAKIAARVKAANVHRRSELTHHNAMMATPALKAKKAHLAK